MSDDVEPERGDVSHCYSRCSVLAWREAPVCAVLRPPRQTMCAWLARVRVSRVSRHGPPSLQHRGGASGCRVVRVERRVRVRVPLVGRPKFPRANLCV